MKRLIIGLVLMSFCLSANGQVKDSFDTKNSFIPIIFFLPETSFAFGAAGIFSWKKHSAPAEQRASQILYSASYTLRNQMLIFMPYEIYSHQQSYRYKGEIGFYKYFYNYYGVGPDTNDSLEVYDVTFPRIEFSATRFINKSVGLGLGFRGDYYNITGIEEDGFLMSDQPVGWEGGIKSNLLALFLLDTRDNINAAKKGFYFELIYQKSAKFLSSDFDYHKWELDTRFYTELQKNWVLAHQMWLTFATDGVPFFDMAHLSTAARGRGLSDRRYINADMYSLQSELRFPIKGRFRGSAFYSINLVPEERSEPFQGANVWTYGLGLRYVLDKNNRNAIRLDLARGEGKINFYLTVNEAF